MYLPISLWRVPALSLISVVLQLRSVTVSHPIAPAKIVPNKIGTGKLVISHVENESEAFKRGRIWVWMRMVLAKKSPRIFRVSLCVSQLNVSFLRPITHGFISCPVDCGPNCNPGKWTSSKYTLALGLAELMRLPYCFILQRDATAEVLPCAGAMTVMRKCGVEWLETLHVWSAFWVSWSRTTPTRGVATRKRKHVQS